MSWCCGFGGVGFTVASADRDGSVGALGFGAVGLKYVYSGGRGDLGGV